MSKLIGYTKEQRIASNRYSSIKSRVKYNLEDYWAREDFIDWYINEEKKCFYCKCTQSELNSFYQKNSSKRKNTRGKTLEVDRIKDEKYNRNNCRLSCYWCNNAKSDVFSFEQFKPIGNAIGNAIKKIIIS